MVTAAQRSAIRSEPLVHSLPAHAERVTDLLPGEAAVMCFDGDPGDELAEVLGDVVDLPGGRHEVVRAVADVGDVSWMLPTGCSPAREPFGPGSEPQPFACSHVAF